MATSDGCEQGSNVEPRTIQFVPVTRAMVPAEWTRGTEAVTPKQDRHILRTLRASGGTGPSTQTLRRQCAECGALEPPGIAFQKCGGCRVVQYCSITCQKRHWKAEHKAVCKITKPAIEHYITVELPDVPLAWQYQDFVAAHSSEDAIGVSITSLEQWATPQRQLLLQETCTSLRDTGMPALIWMRVSVPTASSSSSGAASAAGAVGSEIHVAP